MPTPLGNLRDITLRALDVLRECDLLVAEDTRVARKLLAALDLPGKETWSYREQNASGATPGILERARTQRVAVVCDAGTPGISDPGYELVAAARAAGILLEVLPGPAAFVCGLVLSGFDLRRFTFEGFMPKGRTARESALRAALESGATTVWYESPHRVADTLATLQALAPDATAFIGRELTKRFEQQILGTPAGVLAALQLPVRGEIVLVLGPYRVRGTMLAPNDIEAAIDAELEAGHSPATVAKKLARRGLAPRDVLYAGAIERKRLRLTPSKA